MRRPCSLALSIALFAASDGMGDETRVTVDLNDGSHLVGTTSLEELRVQTEPRLRELSLRRIEIVHATSVPDVFSVTLLGGEILEGKLDLESLPLDTAFGTVALTADVIQRITIRGTLRRRWEFQGGSLKDFELSGVGSWREFGGRVVATAYGEGGRWHGPMAIAPVSLNGDFRIQARVEFETGGGDVGRIAFGVRLDDGKMLAVHVEDGHSEVVGHHFGIFLEDEPLLQTDMFETRRPFKNAAVTLERSGDALRLTVDDALIGEITAPEESVAEAVWFSLAQFKGYAPLRVASFRELEVLAVE